MSEVSVCEYSMKLFFHLKYNLNINIIPTIVLTINVVYLS